MDWLAWTLKATKPKATHHIPQLRTEMTLRIEIAKTYEAHRQWTMLKYEAEDHSLTWIEKVVWPPAHEQVREKSIKETIYKRAQNQNSPR